VLVHRLTAEGDALPATFHRLVVAWAGSLTGDGLRVVALPLLAVSLNPSATAVAAVAAASTLPWLLVAIPAGALVDRLDPARVIATAHLARAAVTLILVALVLTGSATIPLLCLTGFAITSAETFADGSAQSLLVRVVPHAHLERANARFVTVETLALDLAGPLLAGVLFVIAPWSPFALSAACFVAAALTVRTIKSTRPPDDPSEAAGSGATATSGAVARIRAGLSRLVLDPVLRVLVVTVAIMAIGNAATDAVLVLYGTQTLAMSEALYPTLLVAYSVGTLLAAVLVGRSNSRLRGGQTMMVALFGISATMLVLGLIPTVAVALIAFALMGLAGGTWNVLSAARRQRRTPHSMVGRVSSAFRVVAWGVIPIGATLGGFVGERWGVSTVYVASGFVIAVLGLIVMRSFVAVEPEEQVVDA
jgi:MFS family permease